MTRVGDASGDGYVREGLTQEQWHVRQTYHEQLRAAGVNIGYGNRHTATDLPTRLPPVAKGFKNLIKALNPKGPVAPLHGWPDGRRFCHTGCRCQCLRGRHRHHRLPGAVPTMPGRAKWTWTEVQRRQRLGAPMRRHRPHRHPRFPGGLGHRRPRRHCRKNRPTLHPGRTCSPPTSPAVNAAMPSPPMAPAAPPTHGDVRMRDAAFAASSGATTYSSGGVGGAASTGGACKCASADAAHGPTGG